MNIVLFEVAEITQPLLREDTRFQHITRVLRRAVGDSFDVGLVNGPRGKAIVQSLATETLRLTFEWNSLHRSPAPTTLCLGLPRPQTARDVLRDATTLGATALEFVSTARSDPNYAQSSLWTSNEWRRHILQGAAQAFDTFLPEVGWTRSLSQSIQTAGNSPTHRVLALDPYGTTASLAKLDLLTVDQPVTIFIGPERGWDDVDRQLFEAAKIPRYSLGDRVLRTETAVTVALALINAARLRVEK